MKRFQSNGRELSGEELKTFINRYWGYDPAEVALQFVEYQRAYYATIRDLLEKLSPLRDAFPPHMFGNKRITFLYARHGVLVIHGHESEDDEFHAILSEKTLDEEDLAVFFGPDARPSFAEYFRFGFGIKLPDGRMGGLGWTLIEYAKPPFAEISGAAAGKVFAEAEVKAFVAAHIMRLKNSPPDVIVQTLETIVHDFETLLGSARREEDIQSFLRENPILIDPRALEVSPKAKLGSEYQTDFVIRLSKNSYRFIEIERAGLRLYTKKGDQSSDFSHALKQLEDWSQWLREHMAYARSTFSNLNEVTFLLIAGRTHDLTERDERSLSAKNAKDPKTRVLTYDDLLAQAKQHVENLKVLRKSREVPKTEQTKIPEHMERMAIFSAQIAKMVIKQLPSVLRHDAIRTQETGSSDLSLIR